MPSPCCPSPGRSAGPTPSPAASPATRTWCCRRRARSAASSIPAHGAWFIEKLTDELAQKSWALFQEIEAKGGMARGAGERVHPGRDRQDRRGAGERHRDRSPGADGRLGVPAAGRRRRQGRPASAAEPVVKGGTSVAPLPPRRLAEPFERLRDAADAHLAATGKRPQVFLACLGDLAALLGARDLDQELPRRRRHRGRRRRRAFTTRPTRARPSPTAGRAIACICSSDAGLRRAGRGHRGGAEGCRRRPGAARRPARRRRRPRSRRPASTRSFLLVATRSQPLRVSMMH